MSVHQPNYLLVCFSMFTSFFSIICNFNSLPKKNFGCYNYQKVGDLKFLNILFRLIFYI